MQNDLDTEGLPNPQLALTYSVYLIIYVDDLSTLELIELHACDRCALFDCCSQMQCASFSGSLPKTTTAAGSTTVSTVESTTPAVVECTSAYYVSPEDIQADVRPSVFSSMFNERSQTSVLRGDILIVPEGDSSVSILFNGPTELHDLLLQAQGQDGRFTLQVSMDGVNYHNYAQANGDTLVPYFALSSQEKSCSCCKRTLRCRCAQSSHHQSVASAPFALCHSTQARS